MNNLRFLRELTGVTAKELSSLLNITVHTYYGLEKNQRDISLVYETMFMRIYRIPKKEIYCPENVISAETLIRLKELSGMDADRRYSSIVYNLCGQKNIKMTYAVVAKIKQEIEQQIKRMEKCK